MNLASSQARDHEGKAICNILCWQMIMFAIFKLMAFSAFHGLIGIPQFVGILQWSVQERLDLLSTFLLRK